MGKQVHFNDPQAAGEYRSAMREQGYKTRDGKDRNGYFVELAGDKKPSEHIDSNLARQLEDQKETINAIREASGGRSKGQKTIGAIAHGFGNITRAMSNPEDREHKRMRISRVPSRRNMPIASTTVRSPIAPKGQGIMGRRDKHISLAPRRED